MSLFNFTIYKMKKKKQVNSDLLITSEMPQSYGFIWFIEHHGTMQIHAQLYIVTYKDTPT